MSQVESHKGKLVKIKEYSSNKEFAQEVGVYTNDDDIDNNIYNYCVDNEDDLVFINKTLYKIEGHYKNCSGCEDFAYLFPNNDGSIYFVTQFYNGGTYLEEMLEMELELEKNI